MRSWKWSDLRERREHGVSISPTSRSCLGRSATGSTGTSTGTRRRMVLVVPLARIDGCLFEREKKLEEKEEELKRQKR